MTSHPSLAHSTTSHVHNRTPQTHPSQCHTITKESPVNRQRYYPVADRTYSISLSITQTNTEAQVQATLAVRDQTRLHRCGGTKLQSIYPKQFRQEDSTVKHLVLTSKHLHQIHPHFNLSKCVHLRHTRGEVGRRSTQIHLQNFLIREY